MVKKIAIMTSGGDAPGMNAFVRAATRYCIEKEIDPYGIYEGYSGLIDNKITPLNYDSVCNIIQRGGTILKTSRSALFKTTEGRQKAALNLNRLGIDALICCGGNGSYAGLKAFANTQNGEWSGKVIGIPGTIDRDIKNTDYTIGYDTAINTAIEAIDKLRDTGDSHHMHFIVEVMGRHHGALAEDVGIASGANLVITPETNVDLNEISSTLRKKGHDIIVLAEGNPIGGAYNLAKALEKGSKNIETNYRICILGHTQRGGTPTAKDRIMASNMAQKAIDEIINNNANLQAVSYLDNKLILTDL